MENLENILQSNEAELDLKLTLKVLKNIIEKSGHEVSPEYKQLESRIEKRTGFSQQRVNNMYASPEQFDWSDFRELYSKYDIEKFLDQLPSDARIDRDKIFECTNFGGSHIPGLRLNMNVNQLRQLIADRDGHTWTSMSSNRRAKLSEEKRCLRISNGRVEWLKSLTNLKEFAQENLYTKNMTLKMIRELASTHYKNLEDYFDTLDIDQLSQHLISKDAIKYKNEVYFSPLKTFERKIGESLQSSFTTAVDLFRMSKDMPKASFDHESEYFNAELLQFSVDSLINLTGSSLSAEIRAKVAKSRENGEKINFPKLFAGALCYEEKYGSPTKDLKLKYLSRDDENGLSVKINMIDAKKLSQECESSESSSDDEQQLSQVKKGKKFNKKIEKQRDVPLADDAKIEQDLSSNSSFGSCIEDNVEYSVMQQNIDDYEQAKQDYAKLSLSKNFISLKKAVISDFKHKSKENIPPATIYRTIVSKLTSNGLNDRTIKALFYDKDILDDLHRGQARYSKKFDNIFQSLKSDQPITRSSEESVSFNSSEVRNYNTNSEFLNRQNSRRSDQRQNTRQSQDRRSRKELSFDQSKNRQYSYPSNERRNYMVQNSRDNYRPRDSSSNDRYDRKRSNQSNNYYSDRSGSRSRNRSESRNEFRRNDRYSSRSRSQSQGRFSRSNSRNRTSSRYIPRQRSYSNGRSNSRSRDSSYHNKNSNRYQSSNRRDRRSYDKREMSQRDRTVSPGIRNIMRRGLNCSDDYNPLRRFCDKCNSKSHHPFYCQTFDKWTREKCRFCKSNHSEEECERRRQKILN